ncbi:MAG: DNA repair protein RecO [bacterium]
MATYKTCAISIKTAPFAEADKLVTLFTERYGKVKAIAKGARRIPSRLGGRVETFTFADYFIVSGRSLDIITEAEVKETFQFIREKENLLAAAIYMIKLVDSGTVLGQPNPELFDLLLHSLARFKKTTDARGVARDFASDFVVLEGIDDEGLDPIEALSNHTGKDLRSW